MAKGKRIGLVIAVDGEKEFKQQVTLINKSITAMKSELNMVSAEYANNANSLEALTKKHEIQNRIYEESKKKADKVSDALNNSKKNYEKVGKAVEDLKKDFQQQNAALDQAQRAYDDAKASLEKMTKEGKSSEQEIRKQSQEVSRLEKALEQQKKAADDSNTKLAEAQTAYRKCGDRVKDWETKLNNANAQTRKAEVELKQYADYMAEAEQSADHCAESIDKFGKAVDSSSKIKIGLKEGLLAGFGEVIAEKGLDAVGEMVDAAKEAAEFVVDVGSSFEAAMSEVQAISGATGSSLDAMSEKAKELGASTKFTATEVAEAFKYMSLAGWKTEDMLSGIDGVLSLAASSGMELAQASDMVTDYLSAFGMQASESAKIADMLAFAQANSNTTAEQLGEAYGNCAANMHAAGQDIETTTSFLEAFANQGIKGSEAGTKMSAIMRDITAKMKDGKIAIGKTNVEVTDANGNFRDLTDIMTDVEAATQGMGDAERAAALSATFTSRSVGGLNMILTEGMGNVSGYETALRNAGGAAQEAATIMQDNLSGDLTTMNSALEGLGIAAYEYIDGPVRGVVQGVTGIISGLTDVISPQKSEFETFISDVESANKELQTALDNADTAKENAIAEGEKIEYLGERLIALNGIESKSAAQRLEMDGIVQQLGEHIPQIAEAYDKEAGKVQLADGEIRNLITSTKELMVTQALQAQAQEVVNKLVEAQIQYDSARDRLKKLHDAKGALQDLQGEYAALWEKWGEMDDAEFEAAENSIKARARTISSVLSEALGEEVNVDNYAELRHFFEDMVGAGNEVGKIGEKSLETSESITELAHTIGNCKREFGDMEDTGEKVVDQLGGVKSEARDTGDAMGDTADATEESAKVIVGAFELARNAAEEYGEKAIDFLTEAGETAKKIAEEDIAKAAEAGAEAQKNALQDVLDTYHGYVDEIEADMQNKVSLFDKFDGGTDMTAEDMQENMQSYVDGVKKYQENLAYVKEQMGDDLSPEFLQYIEDMGLDAANLLEHYAITIRNQGEEGKQIIKDTNDDYMEYLDLTGEIAEAQAANKVAMEAYNRELGSTPVEFTGLQESIEKATQEASGLWGTMSAETEAALNAAAQTARDCGVKIPEGLSEGIASGEISPKQALAQLEGALQGSIDGMVRIAEEAGLEIPASITAGIESGDPEAMKTAYDKLISYIADNADTAALAEIMDKAGADSTDALGDHAEDAKTEGENVAQAGADGAAGKKPEYKAAGEGNIDEYVAAMSTGKGRAAQRAAEVAQAGYTAAGTYDTEFHDVGYNMSAGIARGINDGSNLVVNAMKGQARDVLAAGKSYLAIKSPSRKFRVEIGQQISAGVAFGIRDKASLAGKEAAKMSAQVYNKAAAWMSKYKKSHKVSLDDEKYYWEEVLQHVKKGTAAYNNAIKKLAVATFSGTGISDSAATAAFKKIESNFGVSRTKTTGTGKSKKTVKKDAEAYYSEIYNAANKYLANMQTLNDWSYQAELEYWEAVQAQLKKGSQAWYDAQRQINNAKSGIADEAADAAAALEEANSQIISDAEDYVRKQQILDRMSTEDELAYWHGIVGTAQEGSDAWYDALEHIKELNEAIAEEMQDAAEEEREAAQERLRTLQSVQSAILSKYKTYYKVSAKAEMDYWDIARQQFREGTDERIEADQAYFDAREEYYDQLAELDEEYAEKKKDIDDELADSIKSLQDTYDDAVNSRKREILSSFNLFEAWDAEGYNKDKLLENLRTQVDGINFWADQLEELGQKGVTQELLDELKAMGPDAAANLWSLNQMTAEQLDEYISLWEEKNRVAQEQARMDNESLWQETQDSIAEARRKAQEELDAAKSEYDKAVADLNTGLTDGLKDLVTQAGDIGEDMVSALVESVRTGVKSVSDEIAKLKKDAEAAQAAARQAVEAKTQAQPVQQPAAQPAQPAPQPTPQPTQTAPQPAQTATTVSAPKKLEDDTPSKNDNILKIIETGTKRSKKLTSAEKKAHVALWEYIVSNYGYAPGNDVYKKLADALNVKASKTVTNDQKNSILTALKKRGYASGTRAVWEDELAWILENARTEYLVRKADQAILQPMRAGDKVISPKGAENVYDFANNPGTFLQPYMRTALEQARVEMARENEALQRQMAALDRTGMGRLNRLMEQGAQAAPVVNVDNSGVLSMMGALASALNRLVELAESSQQVVLDTGALVGAIQQPMSQANASATVRRNRGRSGQ